MNASRLVSIVIPAYKPTFFEETLLSAFAQDHDEVEIVICDDCRDDGIRNIVERLTPISPWPIRYFRNEKPLGEALNVARAIKEARGEYVKFLYDDDALEPECVSSLFAVIHDQPDIKLATGVRRLIDENSEFLPDNPFTAFLFEDDVVIHGPELVAVMSEAAVTFMGEPSSVMCRRDDAAAFGQDIMSLKGLPIEWLGDVTFYVKLLRLGNIAMLRRPLSRFRVSDGQSSNIARSAPGIAKKGHSDYYRLTRELGWLRERHINGDVKVAPLNDRENFSHFNLRAYFYRKTPAQVRRDKIQEWADERRPTPSQKRFIEGYLTRHNGTPSFAVIISDLENQPETLSSTLESIEQATRGWMPPKLFVLYDDSLGIKEQQPERSLTWLPVTAKNRAPQLNTLLQTQTFDWFLMVEAGEILHVAALLKAAFTMIEQPSLRALFADEIAHKQDGEAEVLLRPDFALDYLLSCPAATSKHWIFNRYAVIDAGMFDPHCPQALEFDLILKLIEHEGLSGLEHISEPLVTYASPRLLENSDEAHAISRHLRTRGYEHAQVIEAQPGRYQIKYGHSQQPKVSILIVAQDQLLLLQRCVESILERTTYAHYEIIIVDNNSQTPEAIDWLNGVEGMQLEQVRIVRQPRAASASALNNLAAQHATGEYLLLLSNTSAVLHADWLDNLLNHAQRPEVGVVGAKLLKADNSVQHAGIILGLDDPVSHIFMGQNAANEGYMQRMVVDQNYSAVSAACLMISRTLFDALGGLDEDAFTAVYHDVDLCLRVKESGRLIVWTPHVVLLNEPLAHDPLRRASEQAALYGKWMPYIARDPAYNVNFSSRAQGLQLETATELTWRPLTWRPVPVVLSHPFELSKSDTRLSAPLGKLNEALQIEHVSSTDLLTVAELARLKPDALILQTPWNEASIGRLQAARAFNTARRIYDLNDYPACADQLPHSASAEQTMQALKAGLELMDTVIVSSNGLANQLDTLHANIHVIENRLPERWRHLDEQALPHEKPRVGWVGTRADLNDLAMIGDIIKAFAVDVDWIIMGHCPPELRPYIHELRSPVEGELYPGIIASLNLNVALIPAGQSLYSEHRSTRLTLEFGACGFPVIASDVQGLRNNLPLMRVPNTLAAWTEAITLHINDLDESRRLGQALKQRVLSTWMLDEANIQQWHKALLAG